MKKYLVVNSKDGNDFYIVDDLQSLVKEMYEVEWLNGELMEEIERKFNTFYQVFEINGKIKALN